MGTPPDAAGPDFRDPQRKETKDCNREEFWAKSKETEETKTPNAKEGEETPTTEKEICTPETTTRPARQFLFEPES
ncbi:hypothetical protein NDU88_001666 [Pleurodeles waltl]|uniref:Uncharacterized protein n=1 Tax=Pleurodeles waltl TaxID=8319 RepID=A0AAV7KU00_PLEWA|nr:hypothetical protein NDU88_001666 [Pleurodeles waltl]